MAWSPHQVCTRITLKTIAIKCLSWIVLIMCCPPCLFCCILAFFFFSSKGTISPVHIMISTLNDPAFNCSSLCSCLASCLIKWLKAAFPLVSTKQKHLYGQSWACIAQGKSRQGMLPSCLLQLPYLRQVFMFMHAWQPTVTRMNAFVHSVASLCLSPTESAGSLLFLSVLFS